MVECSNHPNLGKFRHFMNNIFQKKILHHCYLCILAILPLNSLTAAPIDPDDGIYIAVFGGFASLPGNISERNFGNAKYKGGFDAGGALGYQGGPIRYEAEISYIRAATKSFNFEGLPAEDVRGNANATTYMANVIYNFFHGKSLLTPFIGVGLGFAHINATLNSSNTPRFSATRNKLSYQGLAGLRLEVTDSVAVGAHYRYFTTTHAEKFGRRFQAHTANISLAYKFNRVTNSGTYDDSYDSYG